MTQEQVEAEAQLLAEYKAQELVTEAATSIECCAARDVEGRPAVVGGSGGGGGPWEQKEARVVAMEDASRPAVPAGTYDVECNGKVSDTQKAAAGLRWRRALGAARRAREAVPARAVLCVVGFFGFFTNYMLRVAINIAIVAMVQPPDLNETLQQAGGGDNASAPLGECYAGAEDDGAAANLTAGGDFDAFNRTAFWDEERFPWTMEQQSLALGAFYWSYVVALVPGGLLAQRFGAKRVFGGANLLCAFASLLIPVAARTHLFLLVAVRLVQGAASGTTWPAMNVMGSRWIPPTERSKFIATYLGNSVGTAATYPLCGVLIARLGWSAAFYVPAGFTLVWCALWWLLVFDSPAQHPRISKAERLYIEEAVAPTIAATRPAVPWRRMATSLPMWALAISNVGSVWVFMTLLTYGPTYLKHAHGLGIEQNGLVSGLPNVSRFLAALVFSWMADRMLASGSFSLTAVRKISTTLGELVPGVLCLVLTHVGCSASAEVAIMTLVSAFNGAAAAGPLANSVDLAPNFAGTVMAIISLLSMCSGFLVPTVVSCFVSDQPRTLSEWRPVFGVTSAVSLTSCVVYLAAGSGEVQPWNHAPGAAGRHDQRDQELRLRPDRDHDQNHDHDREDEAA
ncbi:sialin-like [Schistocerca nitens]|uniref:sialin-like n=1 Tax=Schistocerca nitens TaxID=7011 RepID=UPI0021181A84|nr:sialin-like [Schistocerca nitens]